MTSLFRYVIATLVLCWTGIVFSADNVVNVYSWAEEIPHSVIDQFEKETGIKVNYSTYDTNEVMLAKLRTSKKVVL